ncbi:MAG: outer membrane beta-barrel protein [Candidatus Zixiibacteriota bacterium]|nr:MAG: outer membrane beta-barrel protein [candidate division Zixibacteria bacterium]
MRKALLLTIVLLAFVSSSFAQGTKPALYLGGGLGLNMGPDEFKDYWKMGINFGGGVGIEVTPNFEILGSVYYNNFPMDEDEMIKLVEAIIGVPVVGLGIEGGSTRILELMVNGKFNIPTGDEASSFSPYLLGGVGFGSLSFSDVTATYEGDSETLEIDESATDIALNIGGGVSFEVGPKVGIFVEGRFVMVLTEGDSTTYLPVRAGVKIKLGS